MAFIPLSPSELRQKYSTFRCCNELCMLNHVKMPVDRSVPFSHCPPLTIQPTVESFDTTVADLRKTIEQIRSDHAGLQKFLMDKFEYKYIAPAAGSSSGSRGHWIYELCATTFGTITVCKPAWLDMYGIPLKALELAQNHIRHHTVSDSLYSYENYDKLTLPAALEFFGLDYRYYESRDYNSSLILKNVPDTRKGLLCTAFFISYFNLVGEKEVRNILLSIYMTFYLYSY